MGTSSQIIEKMESIENGRICRKHRYKRKEQM